MKYLPTTCLILVLTLFLSGNLPCHAQEQARLSKGQTIYVPAYSHIYSGNKEVQSLLAVTLSIRNTDLNHPIEVVSVDYYDTSGNRLKQYISTPVVLNAVGTARYTISQKDRSGGSGANFIVEWKAARPVNIPIIETVMIGSRSSFTSRGQAIIPSN